MDIDPNILTIAYAGSLKAYEPEPKRKKILSPILDWIWTWQIRNINAHTRSAYFLLQALAHLYHKEPAVAKRIRLHFWGSIDPENNQQANELGIGQLVCFEGYKSKAETGRLLRASDVLFLPLESEKNGQRPLFIPGKLYEYLYTGKPILALAGPSDCLDILNRAGTGISCNPFAKEEVANCLTYLVENKHQLKELFRPDFNYIRENFMMSKVTAKLAHTFDELLNCQSQDQENLPL